MKKKKKNQRKVRKNVRPRRRGGAISAYSGKKPRVIKVYPLVSTKPGAYAGKRRKRRKGSNGAKGAGFWEDVGGFFENVGRTALNLLPMML